MFVVRQWVIASLFLIIAAVAAEPETTAVVNHNVGQSASGDYRFQEVRQPARNDIAAKATFAIVDGRRDRNGGGLEKLNDGKLPTEPDQPSENFFFRSGSDGGRILVDLGRATEIQQINTYSWHPSARGPQVYKLYASTGDEPTFELRPNSEIDPATKGWSLIRDVDSRLGENMHGGQYGVSIQARDGAIGSYRYLLFDIAAAEQTNAFGNTFYSEIDVLGPDSDVEVAEPAVAPRELRQQVVVTEDGQRITIDTSEAPDLTVWAQDELAPVVQQWYPKIVRMLRSDGFQAPDELTITFFDPMRGVANTSGTRVRCAAPWFRRELDGEAKGAVVHELVHVAQQYRRARRNSAGAPPGWIVEGVADYIRWFLYEPESQGAVIRPADIDRVRYDGNYRVSANFLNWATNKFDQHLVAKLNAAAREGKYSDTLWNDLTGHSLNQLDELWKADLKKSE